MPATISFLTTRDQDGNNAENRTELYQQLDSVGSSDAVRLQGNVTVQLSGTATSCTAIVERASRDPGSAEVNWAPAEDDPFSGDLSAGMAPRAYEDPAVGFWRVRVTTLTGGYCRVSIVGERT